MLLGRMRFGSFGTSRYIQAVTAFGFLVAESFIRSPRSWVEKDRRVGTSLPQQFVRPYVVWFQAMQRLPETAPEMGGSVSSCHGEPNVRVVGEAGFAQG